MELSNLYMVTFWDTRKNDIEKLKKFERPQRQIVNFNQLDDLDAPQTTDVFDSVADPFRTGILDTVPTDDRLTYQQVILSGIKQVIREQELEIGGFFTENELSFLFSVTDDCHWLYLHDGDLFDLKTIVSSIENNETTQAKKFYDSQLKDELTESIY